MHENIHINYSFFIKYRISFVAITSKTLTTVTKRGRGSRTTSDRPPPGAVNLERSYEICRAVIQNSPNRHQLKAQLRPPPSMLTKNVQITSCGTTQGTAIAKFVKKLPEEETPIKTNKLLIKVNRQF